MSNVITFRAGILKEQEPKESDNAAPGQKLIVADKRKGTFTLEREEASYFHLTWKERGAGGDPEVDLIIVPGDVTFSRVKNCTTGRVFLVEFVATKQRYFFWLQESKEDKDAELEAKLSSLLNPEGSSPNNEPAVSTPVAPVPQTPVAPTNTAAIPPTPSAPVAVPSSAARVFSTPSAPATSSQLPGVSLQNLQNILAGFDIPEAQENVDLNDIVNAESVAPLLSPETIALLKPHLPNDRSYDTAEDILSLVRSPQFQQAVDSFGHALQTDQLAMLLVHFNLDPNIIATTNSTSGVEVFLKAIQAKYHKKE